MKKIKLFILKLESNDYIFSVGSKLIGIITGLLYSVLFSRYFQTSLRGSYSVISTYADLIVLISCMGMYQAYPYYKKSTKNSIYMEFINMISGIFIVFLCIAAGAVFVFWNFMELRVAIVLIPFMFVSHELNYVILIENPKTRNVSFILLSFFDIILILLYLMFFEPSFISLFSFLLIKEIICFVVTLLNLKIKIGEIRPSFHNTIKYMKFGFLPMITILMMDLNYKADIVMLNYFNIEKEAIGVYSLGLSLAQKVWMIPDALKDILLSKLAKGRKEDEVCRVTRVSLLVVVVLCTVLIIFGKPFIKFFYGSSFIKSYEIMIILLIGIIGMIFYKMIYSYNVIMGERKINLAILSSAAVLNVVINVVSIPQYGIWGAAFASAISYTLCGVGFLFNFAYRTRICIKEILCVKKKDLNDIIRILQI